MLEREEAGSSLILSVPQVNVLGFQKARIHLRGKQSLNSHSQPVPLPPMLKDDKKIKLKNPLK